MDESRPEISPEEVVLRACATLLLAGLQRLAVQTAGAEPEFVPWASLVAGMPGKINYGTGDLAREKVRPIKTARSISSFQ